MISKDHVLLMARYNRWQNVSLFNAANAVSEKQRSEDRGAFFGSLHTTLAHILWADRVWMNRFDGTPATNSEDNQGRGVAYQDWRTLRADRAELDETIVKWAIDVSDAWLEKDFSWWNTAGTRQSTQPAWRLVVHFFNHQTHHRGQAHALLTAFGAAPEDTDLLLLSGQESEAPR
jgi:uncharacterized damage-inducible protein DinB